MVQALLVSAQLLLSAAELYCPTADDLTVAYCDPGPDITNPLPCPELVDQGWNIKGGGGAATKSSFNLNGGFVEFDMDVSNVDTGVNSNIYTISPKSFALDHFNKSLDYCDGAASGDSWCMEADWVEANGHCGGATTLHTVEGPGSNGCTAWGCRVEYHFNGQTTVHMKVEYANSGEWTVTRNGEVLSGFSPNPDTTAWNYVKQMHEERGAVLYSSEWTGWVPVNDCGTSSGDLYGSSFSISNLKISGSVVQGPTPHVCGTPMPTPTPTPEPSPTPSPTPPPPTPSGCPGGSLSACIDLCPADTFSQCVTACQKQCQNVLI